MVLVQSTGVDFSFKEEKIQGERPGAMLFASLLRLAFYNL